MTQNGFIILVLYAGPAWRPGTPGCDAGGTPGVPPGASRGYPGGVPGYPGGIPGVLPGGDPEGTPGVHQMYPGGTSGILRGYPGGSTAVLQGYNRWYPGVSRRYSGVGLTLRRGPHQGTPEVPRNTEIVRRTGEFCGAFGRLSARPGGTPGIPRGMLDITQGHTPR